MGSRITLIHATPVAVNPVKAAFRVGWSDAEVVNILDDSLSIDRGNTDELTDNLAGRIKVLGGLALDSGATGILYTCSAFGSAIEAFARQSPVPTLKPNEAMFEKALSVGMRIALVYTFAPAAASMAREFEEAARAAGVNATLTAVVCEGAIEAARAGDIDRHNELVAQTAAGIAEVDAIMLAHFSTSTARNAVEAVVDVPVLTSPDAAVAKLKALLA